MKRTGFKKRITPLKTSSRKATEKLPKKPKSHNASWWKKKADRLMSLYVRQFYANDEGYEACYTCGDIKHWKELQNGHFVSRKELATRFLLSNTRPQCWGCNAKHLGNGMTAKFAVKLDDEMPGIVALLYKKAQEITPMRVSDYQAICKDFERELALLLSK